jgi:protoporphyrinogen/coproporphyrinogen III oxidase
VNQAKKVSILGFGFSGLTGAWAFLKQGYQVEVFEKSNKVGGLLQTRVTDLGIIESAANAILKSDNVELMARDFGITWAERKKTINTKWIYTDKPHRWPLSFGETTKSFWPLLQLAVKNPKSKPMDNETVTNWGLRIFGSPRFVDKLLGPALQGIYAQGPDKLSASLSLKRLFLKNPIKNKGSYSPKNGMSEFFEKGLNFLNQSPQFKLHLNSEKDYMSLDSDIVIDSRADYKNVDYLSVISVTMFFENKDRPKFQGFGCLFSKSKKVLGVLFNSDIFEGRSNDSFFSETWIVSDDYVDDKETIEDVLVFREGKFGISSRPVYYSVTYWPQGIPNYNLNHERFLTHEFQQVIKESNKSIIKVGNYTGDIGLNKILENNVRISKSDLII